MYDHEKEWPATHIERLKQLHHDFSAKYNAAQYAQIEGVYEITIRSVSQDITVALDGNKISQLVIEYLDRKLNDLENGLTWHQSQFPVELNESPALAQQAAASAAVQQEPRRPGRPKKVAAVLAGQAAAGPMNGSTAHAVGRAVGSTPQA